RLKHMIPQSVRTPSAAGVFYPADPRQLQILIRDLLSAIEAPHSIQGPIIGGIVPHAGYRYSGTVASQLYVSIHSLHPQRVILIGPSHYQYFGYNAVYDGTVFSTPLGHLGVDQSFAEKLCQHPLMTLSSEGHGKEHAIEIQLPFLQEIYSHPYSIVPITMGNQRQETTKKLAHALLETWESDQIVLASSDLSHFYEYQKAVAMDCRFYDLLVRADIESLWGALNCHEIEACGFGPVMTLLQVAKSLGIGDIKILACGNSGDVTMDRNTVVGYLSALIYGVSE
ncbi:MAG TPA: AmmeMemoRadiSam system protein B, partial [bacterium]|nr:AmmeMemoRadiSam system protein B [bacterium]